jgi:2-methylcitrate dehydratase PrpD
VTKEHYLASDFAAFALSPTPFPAKVVREAKRILLDQIACQLAASTLPWSLGFLAAEKAIGGEASATIVYHGDRLRLDQVAFVNGAFGQGAEFDDTHLRSSTHSGAVVVPTVLAIAENRKMSGRAVIDAIIVGIETIIRLSTSAAPHLHNRGHHVPPATGPFGAAVAASRMLGFDHVTTQNAFSIAGSHSCGLLEFTHAGGSIKRGHCGIAAMGGLRSAMLAERGITGPPSILEGERGFLKSFAGTWKPELLEKLGEEYIFLEMGYKPMTSAFPAHAPLEAIGWLKDTHGLSPEDVAKITVGTSIHSREHVGIIREPRDITDAHYSVAYGAAVRFYRGGNGFFDYREEDLTDPRYRALENKVEVVIDPQAEEERLRLNNRGAIVIIETTDGRRLEKRIQYSRGHPMNPLTDEDMIHKFQSTVEPRLGAKQMAELLTCVQNVESLDDVGELIRLTVARQ